MSSGEAAGGAQGREWLDEIEARANAATEGPWTTHVAEGERLIRPGVLGAQIPPYPVARVRLDNIGYCDAEFIAHARSDVPRLVAEVRRLQAVIGATPHASARLAESRAERDALSAELAAARERLAAVEALLPTACTCPPSSMFNGPSARCPTHGRALAQSEEGQR